MEVGGSAPQMCTVPGVTNKGGMAAAQRIMAYLATSTYIDLTLTVPSELGNPTSKICHTYPTYNRKNMGIALKQNTPEQSAPAAGQPHTTALYMFHENTAFPKLCKTHGISHIFGVFTVVCGVCMAYFCRIA